MKPTTKPTCNCWVATKSEEERFGIRYGAHSTACPVYRPSGDILDASRDVELREANELRVTDDDAGQNSSKGLILRIY